jgi:hypothetical protein
MKRGNRVVLSFDLGNPSQLATMLWNMRSRAVVGGPVITCAIDGVRQAWWDDQQEEDRKRHEEWARRDAIERAERDRIHAAIEVELDRDPTRSNEEIAALVPGLKYPNWVKMARDTRHTKLRIAIQTELERDPERSDAELAVIVRGADAAVIAEAKEWTARVAKREAEWQQRQKTEIDRQRIQIAQRTMRRLRPIIAH